MGKEKAIVIGAGIGGLATACRLANLGFEVEVCEQSGQPGGKAAELLMKDFRFDMGPSLFTMPELLDQLFIDCGKNPADYYHYDKLDIITRYFYPDHTVVDAYADPEELAKEFHTKLGEPEENVRLFLKRAKEQYELTADMFLFGSMHKWKNYFSTSAFKTLLNLPKLETWRSMAKSNEARFRDSRTRQLFNRYATYNGSDPYRAPATLNLIAHLEHNIGAFFLDGGMHKLSQSLARLAKDLGVSINYHSGVDEIILKSDRVKGVRIGQEKRAADLVVSNMDVVPTYRKLLPHLNPPKKILNQERSTSAMIFFWGMDTEADGLEVHNIFFSDDYPGEFKALSLGGIGDDLTVYLYVSSLANKTDAPAGKQNWFVMINVPADQGQDWDEIKSKARATIIRKLNKHLGFDVEKHIEAEDYLDPTRIESRTSSFQGALYGASSNNQFAAFLRHPNFHPKISNLYFCGGSVHPGGGIPLCLASAKIIETLI
jgi:phytoene desaturase